MARRAARAARLASAPTIGASCARQRRDALDALALRAQLLVKDDAERLQLLQPLVERLVRLVLVIGQGGEIGQPEMARVGEARAHDAAIARRDRLAAVARDEVRDEDELVGELALGIAQHEAFLVGADRRADHFRRDFQEGRVEFAHQHDRPFDEAGDLVEQPLVLDELEPLREREAVRVGRMMCLRRSASSTTLALASAAA